MTRYILFTVSAFLIWSSASAQIVRQVTDVPTSSSYLGVFDDAGDDLFALSDEDLLGTNPERRHQIYRWDLIGGEVEQITFFPEGLVPSGWSWAQGIGIGLDDAGQTIAFLSRGDLTGQNADGNTELFVMQVDGSSLLQLTSTTAVDSWIGHIEMSGDGSRIVFDSNAPHLGPTAIDDQVYVVNTDGTGLLRVSDPLDYAYFPSISDDGQRIVMRIVTMRGFEALAAVNGDGSNYRILPPLVPSYEQTPKISGDGSKIVFLTTADLPDPPGRCDGDYQAAVIDWDGTNLRGLSGFCQGSSFPGYAVFPDIEDNGGTTVHGGFGIGFGAGVDGPASGTLYEIQSDGTNRRQLLEVGGCLWSRISGNGSRIAFACESAGPFPELNPDCGREIYVMDLDGSNLQQLSRGRTGDNTAPDVTSDGSSVVFISESNLLFEHLTWNADNLYRMASDGSLVRLTNVGNQAGTLLDPSISDDGQLVAFAYDGDPLGSTRYWEHELFVIEGDGSNLVQLTTANANGGAVSFPGIADGGSVIVFVSDADFGGLNPSAEAKIWTIAPNGSGLTLVGPQSGDGMSPRLDASGTWLTYVAGDVFRARTDGSTTEQLTAFGGCEDPDIDAAGTRVVFSSTADPLGQNPEQNREIFVYDSTAGLSQLSRTTDGDNERPRISRDGSAVFFSSTSSQFGVNATALRNRIRGEIATGELRRVDALDPCGTSDVPLITVPDAAGRVALTADGGNCVDRNPDRNFEILRIDLNETPRIAPGPGLDPTVVSWDAEAGLRRYDVVRGDLASLSSSGGAVDLGEVACVENDSIDLDTAGSEDLLQPMPGQGFFYLYRGDRGDGSGPGSYGAGSTGLERLPMAGDCDPSPLG